MSRRPGESAAQWYERAIVANSVASGQLEDFADGPAANPAAQRAFEQRAKEAAADLASALEAFRAERRGPSGS
jgi:hypothetical protein